MDGGPHGRASAGRRRSPSGITVRTLHDTRTIDVDDHSRDARAAALAAIVEAAGEVGVEPAALSRPDYHAVCRDRAHRDLPSAVTISALFGGWQRAREQIAVRHLRAYRPGELAGDGRR
jgi:hypothetical protein